jgi:ferric-dicitrate binding protein FerR (iron transport regulator)
VNGPPLTPDDDEVDMTLLRVAGPRPSVPGDRFERLRAPVRERWKTEIRRRRVRRRVAVGSASLAAAAAVALVVALVNNERNVPAARGAIVATIERFVGPPGALAAGAPVRNGEWVETMPGGRAALRFADGAFVQLDTESRIRAVSSRTLELTRGGVYVDTGDEPGGFEVRTSLATARDIGTQFEIRLQDDALRVRVRTGIVELSAARRRVTARAGTEVLFSSSAADTRALPASASDTWGWTLGLLPRSSLEGLTLAAFLERAGRENGWTIRYADATLERQAATIVLHGMLPGVPPAEAVAVVIRTSGLTHELRSKELLVRRPRESR